MTPPLGATLPPPAPEADRREHRRIALALLGRYRLATRQEYPCLSVDISLSGVSILAPVKAPVGERVILHLEQIGTLEGPIVRHTMWGMALEIAGTVAKRERLAAQLAWLEARQAGETMERRRHLRIVPASTAVLVRLADESEVATRLIDVSRSGAAVRIDPRPPIGAAVTLGRTPAVVVRHFEGGIAVEFRSVLERARFNEAVIL